MDCHSMVNNLAVVISILMIFMIFFFFFFSIEIQSCNFSGQGLSSLNLRILFF